MKRFLKYAVLFLLLLQLFPFLGNGAYAQLYPVQVTPIFNSPYSVRLSDYATSMDTKMQLLINPTDITISQRQVRLKMYLQGNGLNVQSSDYIQGLRPIFINGGELQTLTNTDISALFRLENLQGITALQYANGLPEGMYSFCFELYDFVTNQKISQKSCASLYLLLNDPPLLNTPQRNEKIVATEFPNILFTWTPRQRNATNVSYQFELKQLLDPTLDPQIAFQMSPVLYEETLFGTALLYHLNMPMLTPGLRYAWRVKAISTSGLSENSVFKNDGYSEIYSFTYKASCAAPTFLLSETQPSKSVKITWQGTPAHTRYQVQYKKEGVPNAQWFSTLSLNTQSLLTNLEPGVSYQFRVGASCEPAAEGDALYNYSGISTFTMPEESRRVSEYNCGIVPSISLQNQTPLTNLIQSETFTAGDFPVTILELEGHNPYSGRGFIVVPYLANNKIAVEFKDIVVNTDYQLIGGVVETSYNPEWKNVVDVEDFTGEGEGGQIEETVPFEVQDIVINANGDIVVNGKDGEQITIPGGKDTVITDAKGNTYTVDKSGNGSNEPVVAAAGGKPTPENTDGVDKSGQATAFTAKGISIAFSSKDSKYAFDVMPEKATAALQKLYKKVNEVVLPYKAVVNGDSDTVLATVSLTDTAIKLDSIVFKTQNGAKIDFKRSDKVFELTVKGKLTYAEEQILATVKQDNKWKVIGAFMLVHISRKEVNVALVPTDATSQSKLDAVIAKTQEIYNKVGVKINFKKDNVLNIDSVVSGNTIQTDKNTLTSTYSSDQQKINALYQGTDNSYVLFITNKASSTGQKGYMRLNGQFGYVFATPSGTGGAKTPAHELGHGIFKLAHPFETYKTTESSTDLLMDYSEGTVLNHQDWKQINDPAFKLYSFQGQSSGELAGGYALAPDWRFVSNGDETTVKASGETDTKGFLRGITTKEGTYIWKLKDGKYNYLHETTNKIYENSNISPNANSTIWLFFENQNSRGKYIRTKYSVVEAIVKSKSESDLSTFIKKNSVKDLYTKGKDENRTTYWGYVGCSNCDSNGLENGAGSGGLVVDKTAKIPADELKQLIAQVSTSNQVN
ncbi:fibronectin type III domain-containing protein, partial [Flavobacterium succinicans]|uniref:fibronectin type III domain-containing protein n=1 Tax=Flavobacterium succinicans TaxID=29536 RepID=UPI0009EF1A62